jgi:predicted RNase H-like nuclease
MLYIGGRVILAGVDLAWHSEKNPSAIAYGHLVDHVLSVSVIESVVYGVDSVFDRLNAIDGLQGVSIDAPLIINNSSGQRVCEREIGRAYGSRGASCHTSNTTLYPDAKSVYLSKRMFEAGFSHLKGERWQIECYPHPAIIEIFGLNKRLKYKKGTVADKRAGQKTLSALLRELNGSSTLRLTISGEESRILDESNIESLRGQALKSNEDALDSVLCLYVAGLYAIEYSGKVFGNISSGYIWVPRGACM